MYPFFETIRFKNGVLENVSYHQARIDRTFSAHHKNAKLNLKQISIHVDFIKEAVYKCKVLYNLDGAFDTSFEIYQTRAIHSVAFVPIENKSYDFKFTNRAWLNKAFNQAHSDEIIMIQDGIIKDGMYSNLVFFNGTEWHTPLYPLLLGTHRARLIDEKKIFEKNIRITNLADYEKVKFINAMILWSDSSHMDMKDINPF